MEQRCILGGSILMIYVTSGKCPLCGANIYSNTINKFNTIPSCDCAIKMITDRMLVNMGIIFDK